MTVRTLVGASSRSGAAASAPAAPSLVTVARGDTLWGIAKQHRCKVSDLVKLNSTRYPSLATNADRIRVGWKLRVPPAQTSGRPAAGPASTSSAGRVDPDRGSVAAPAWRPPGPAQRPDSPSEPAVPTSPAARPDWPEPAELVGPVGEVHPIDEAAAAEAPGPTAEGVLFASGGAEAIEKNLQRHLTALKKTGVGVYYGDHSPFKAMSQAEKKAWVSEHTKPGQTPPALSALQVTSCIGWAMDNVKAAYVAAGKEERWAEIVEILDRPPRLRGTVLAEELAKDGWQGIYFNADTTSEADDGAHNRVAAARPRYWKVPVTDRILDFRRAGYEDGADDQLAKLSEIPFFFGVANAGTHTFVGRNGNVSEFHWKQNPDSKTAIEETPLKEFDWESGIVMVPPKSWFAD
jgi:murein DD-endopeptidase MepM/ murein hydrolase activator NlpD